METPSTAKQQSFNGCLNKLQPIKKNDTINCYQIKLQRITPQKLQRITPQKLQQITPQKLQRINPQKLQRMVYKIEVDSDLIEADRVTWVDRMQKECGSLIRSKKKLKHFHFSAKQEHSKMLYSTWIALDRGMKKHVHGLSCFVSYLLSFA